MLTEENEHVCINCGVALTKENVSSASPILCTACGTPVQVTITTTTRIDEEYDEERDEARSTKHEARRITFDGGAWLRSDFGVAEKSDTEIRKLIEIQRAHINLMEQELLMRKIKRAAALPHIVHVNAPTGTGTSTSSIIKTTRMRTTAKPKLTAREAYQRDLDKQKIPKHLQERMLKIFDAMHSAE